MRSGRRDVVRVALVLVAAALVLGLWLANQRDTPTASPTGSGSATTTATDGPSSASVPPARDTGGLPVVAAADLPREARETIALIEAGGPFRYARDGVTFGNRERLLPRHPSGWYREYTVPTPGEDDRGARRIVTGRDGTVYWTDDHYASFSVVQEQP
ncbi:ribonuclease domain-containing protein [Oryzobacter telluris]|uniref:ribonuclease domain-containing protein n=1 Tax=Oryzobacter telluris TaxID=3149179 RepID=UPI00370D02B5